MDRDTPYGPLHKSLTVHGRRVEVINPAAHLWTICSAGGSYSTLMHNALENRPPNMARPWRLALYSDEVTPGNVISHDNLRKAWAIYWGIIDISRRALHSEDAWLLLCLKRSSEVKEIPAGISAVMAACVEQFITGGAYDVTTVGWHLVFPNGSSCILWLRVEQFIQDDAAHKFVFHCVGASGTRFCLICQNIRARRKETLDLAVDDEVDDGDDAAREVAELAADEADVDARIARDELLVSDIITKEELHLATEASVHEALDKLDAYAADVAVERMTPQEFRDRQQALGFRHVPESILRIPRLRPHVQPTRQFAHDPMHVFAVHGVINIVLYCCLHLWEQQPLAISWATVRGYIERFWWPHSQGGGSTRPYDVLKDKRIKAHKKAKSFKCQASECIALLPIITLFALVVVMPLATDPEQIASCLVLKRLLEVVELVFGAARPPADVEAYARRIDAAVERFLYMFKNTFPVKFMVTKFHAMLHFGDELRRFGTLLSCFVHERKHIMVRDFCNTMRNTISFERSVMSNVVCQQLHDLGLADRFNYAVGLVNPRPATRELAQLLCDMLPEIDASAFTMAHIVRFNTWSTCAVGDAVLVQDGVGFCAGWVWKHASAMDVAMSLIQFGDLVAKDTEVGVATWRLQEKPAWVLADNILEVCIFSWEGPRSLRTLLPRAYRY
jgi:hypothetical protein